MLAQARPERKFLELLLFIAQESETDPDFGMTVLHKILFNSDFIGYSKWGRSITEQEYQKLPYGPCARNLLPAIEALKADGAAAVQDTTRGPYRQVRLIALRDPDLSLFSGEEIALVERVMSALRGRGAKGVSDLSHEFPGWQIAMDRETIPYDAVFLSGRALTQDEYLRGATLEREGWAT